MKINSLISVIVPIYNVQDKYSDKSLKERGELNLLKNLQALHGSNEGQPILQVLMRQSV